MKTLLTLFAAAALLTCSAFADIRSYHGGIAIGVGGSHGGYHGGHYHSGYHGGGYHGGYAYHRPYYNPRHVGFGYGSIFHPSYFAYNYAAPIYPSAERTVIVRERTPAPSSTAVFTTPDTFRDARSPAQLQQIYGDQAAALSR